MTLQELFSFVGENPIYVFYFFVALPVLAGIIGLLGDDKCHKSPWKEFFMIIIYAVMIPGIFALFLNIYMFLFDRRSVMSFDVFLQILPILSMVVTLFVIRKYIAFDYIPGFDKISGLVLVISALIMILYFADRFRIIAFTYMPFQYLVVIFIVLLLIINYGLRKLLK